MFYSVDKIDFLSPPITLFHLEKRTHISHVGGFLVIIMLSICSSYICFLFYGLITHKRITSLFHKKFEYEAGYYSFNSSSIFHFIQIFSSENGGYFDKYNSKYIRAYTTYVHSNLSYTNLDLYDHWVFDTCRKDIDNKGLESHLFDNVDNFTNGVCIRYYYNSKERKYYSLEEESFHWPYLEHGIAQKNNIYLTTIIEKCSNDSIINELFGPCPTQKEIDNYISKYFAIYLYFSDTQVDPTNYTKPVQKYLQVISTGIGTSNSFIENYIYFSPVKVQTKIGSLFGKTYDINSFIFDYNRRDSANNNEEKYYIIAKYYHLMQNNIQIYERKYSNVFDIFSEIGGVIQFIFYLFYWTNYFYNKYIIAYDTNSLFFSIRDNRSSFKDTHRNNLKKNDIKLFNLKDNNDRNMKKSKCFMNKINLNINNNQENQLNNVKEQIFVGKEQPDDKDQIKLSKIVNKKDNKDKNLNSNKNKNERFSLIKSKTKYLNHNSSNIFLKEGNIIENEYKKGNNSFIELYKNLEINLDNKPSFYKKNLLNIISLSRGSLAKIEHRHKKDDDISDDKLKSIKVFSFYDFLKSMMFKRNKGNHYFISLFRKHLLSEEHFLKSHIKMVFLEKQHKNVLECFNEL